MNLDEAQVTAKVPCPYSNCTGWVSPGQKRCLKCRLPLAPCPNCGQIMGEDLGVCSVCKHVTNPNARLAPAARAPLPLAPLAHTLPAGPLESITYAPPQAPVYTAPAPAAAPTEKRTAWTETEAKELIANAYRGASLAGANMARAVDVLQDLRSTFLQGQDLYQSWDAIDDHIGQTDDRVMRQALMELRERFIEQVQRFELDRLRAALKKDPETGWEVWLEAFAEALSNWRMLHCLALTDPGLPFGRNHRPQAARYRRLVELLQQDRHAEAIAERLELAGMQSLPAGVRASLLTHVAGVYLYTLEQLDRVRELLEQAQAIDPYHKDVLQAWGEYWLKRKELEQARPYFEELIQRYPEYSEGYNQMGEFYLMRNDLESAEDWYRQAIQHDPGSVQGYINLIRLYARSELFAERKGHLADLVQLADSVEPPNHYQHCLEIAEAYTQNSEFATAHVWYDRAISYRKDWPQGYLYKGYALLLESKLSEAEQCLTRASQLAPEAFDSYWGLAFLYESQSEWQKALEMYKLALERRPEWEERIRTSIANLYINLDESNKAEEELLRLLEMSPGNESALTQLQTLAYVHYTTLNQPEDARRVYGHILRIKGSSYNGEYENRLGNIDFYLGDYEAAAGHYRQAIAAEPQPVFFDNLALALEKSSMPENRAARLEEAIAVIQQGMEQVPEASFAPRLEGLLLKQKMLRTYGEMAFAPAPEEPPLKAEFSTNLGQHYLTEDRVNLSEPFLAMVKNLRGQVKQDFGFEIPGIFVTEVQDDDPDMGTYLFSVYDVPVVAGKMPVNSRYYSGDAEDLRKHRIKTDEETGLEGLWVPRSEWERAEKAGLDLWDPILYPMVMLLVSLDGHVYRLFTHQQAAAVLLEAEVISGEPDDRLLSAFTACLRALLKERIRIPDIKAAALRFFELWSEGKNPFEITNALRLLPEIRTNLPGNEPDSTLLPLGPSLEAELAAAVRTDLPQPALVMDLNRSEAVLDAVMSAAAAGGADALVVADPTLRPLVRELAAGRQSDLPVLARTELGEDPGDRMLAAVEVSTSEEEA